MTEQEKAEIRKIIKEEIDAKLTTPAKAVEDPQVPNVTTVRSEVKPQVNIETVSPAY